MGGLIVIPDEQETKDQKRKRLAGELRFISEQFNSKLLELVDSGVDVTVHLTDHHLKPLHVRNKRALHGHLDISYQTPPKHY